MPARGHTRRLLFRHETPSKARGATFYDDLRLELLGSLSRRRQLLSEEESANVHASALDGVTGIDVLETPPGELNAWLLQALQSHPSKILQVEQGVSLTHFALYISARLEVTDLQRLHHPWYRLCNSVNKGGAAKPDRNQQARSAVGAQSLF